MAQQLTKTAIFTDLHFGRKNNSDQHNQDCVNYLEWFCETVRADGTIDSVVFMGDWFENRSAIDIKTMNYSYIGAKMINELGVPVFFIVGNHDLYQRNTREIFSTAMFHELQNFHVIDRPKIIKSLGSGSFLCPYVFEEEYDRLKSFLRIPVWFGHFEFRGFQITGYNMTMQHGPESSEFHGPKRIFSGHFHKRQIRDNINYIGNTFPMDFGDAGDIARGMCIYDHDADKVKFIDWTECPRYVKIKLSDLIDDGVVIPKGARVRCEVDTHIDFHESSMLRKAMVKQYCLREFTLEEGNAISDALKNTDAEIEGMENVEISNVDDMIIEMLSKIRADGVDNSMLLQLYEELA